MTTNKSLLAALVVVLLAGAPAVGRAQPGARDTLTIAQFVDPPNLDPYNTTAPYISVFAQICEPLIYWDSDASGNAVIKRLLATDYRWLDDTRLQFKLRPGVRFSNGEPFNAAAAKFSLEQLFAAFNYSQWLKDLLKEVTVVDDQTVVLALTKPAGYVVSVLAYGSFQVAPKDFQTRGKDAFNQSPVCTGPWVFKEHRKDSHITLTANPTYWGGTPKFKTITYRVIPDDAARVAALEAGEVDIAPNVPHSAAARVERNSDLRLATIPSLRQFATFIDVANPKAKPLEDARVRLALNLAIDRAAICKQIFAGRCTPKDGQPLSKWHSGHNPALKPYPYDPAQARKLLADAGHPNGFELDYTYTTGRYPLDKPAGEAMASYLRAVGLKINERAVDFPQWAREFDSNPAHDDGDLHRRLPVLSGRLPVDAELRRGPAVPDERHAEGLRHGDGPGGEGDRRRRADEAGAGRDDRAQPGAVRRVPLQHRRSLRDPELGPGLRSRARTRPSGSGAWG